MQPCLSVYLSIAILLATLDFLSLSTAQPTLSSVSFDSLTESVHFLSSTFAPTASPTEEPSFSPSVSPSLLTRCKFSLFSTLSIRGVPAAVRDDSLYALAVLYTNQRLLINGSLPVLVYSSTAVVPTQSSLRGTESDTHTFNNSVSTALCDASAALRSLSLSAQRATQSGAATHWLRETLSTSYSSAYSTAWVNAVRVDNASLSLALSPTPSPSPSSSLYSSRNRYALGPLVFPDLASYAATLASVSLCVACLAALLLRHCVLALRRRERERERDAQEKSYDYYEQDDLDEYCVSERQRDKERETFFENPQSTWRAAAIERHNRVSRVFSELNIVSETPVMLELNAVD